MNNRGGGFPVWVILQFIIMILPRTIGHAFKHGWIHLIWGIIVASFLMSIQSLFGSIAGIIIFIISIVCFILKLRKNRRSKRNIAQYWAEQSEPSIPRPMRSPKYTELDERPRPRLPIRGSTEPILFPTDLIPRTAPHGFFFGEKDGDYIIRTENPDSNKGEKEGHIMVVGGSGSGKSSCIAIPTLRMWREPVFVVDIKGELYEQSKIFRHGYRGSKQIIICPSGIKESIYGYEPFIFIRNSLNPAVEAREITSILIEAPQTAPDPHWHKGAQSILEACILHFYQKMSFIDMVTKISYMPMKALINMLSESTEPYVRQIIASFVDLSDRQLGGYFALFGEAIKIFSTNEDIKYILSREKSVSPADLESGYDIFILPPDLREFHSFLNLIISQFLTYFKNRKINRTTKPILFLLDEFPNIGKMPRIPEAMATLRSQKVTVCVIIQDLGQLDEIYGKNVRSSIISNCAYIAILRVNDAEAQAYFSNMVGTYERIKITQTEGNIINTAILNSQSIQMTEEEKKREKPHHLAFIEYIVLITPYKEAVRIRRKPYYENSYDETGISDLFTVPVDEYIKF